MRILVLVCACVVSTSGCSWDTFMAFDAWLDRHFTVTPLRTDGPFSESQINKSPIGDPYHTPIHGTSPIE